MTIVKTTYRPSIIALFTAGVFALLIGAGLAACKKEGSASATGLNTQLNIINLSPDVNPLLFYVDQVTNVKKKYIYSVPSGYAYLNSLEASLQLRNERTNAIVFDSVPKLRANTRYTLMITGLVSEKTRSYIFVTDTDAVPGIGKGKVRFINALARSGTLDVTANGTMAFKAQATNKVSSFIEMPAGMYDFKFLSTGTTSVLIDLPNITIQDGRLYTLYTRGIIGRTDTAAVAASMITNR